MSMGIVRIENTELIYNRKRRKQWGGGWKKERKWEVEAEIKESETDLHSKTSGIFWNSKPQKAFIVKMNSALDFFCFFFGGGEGKG